MNLRLVTEPTEEPVTVDEAKDWLRITDESEDYLIASLIVAARQYAETFLQRAIVSQTWELGLDDFPSNGVIKLPFPNLISVSSVKYYDDTNVQQTLSSDNYLVITNSLPGQVELKYGFVWPSTYTRSNAVLVEFVAGYGDSSLVPDGLKTAILSLVAHYFENRQPVAEGISLSTVPMHVAYQLSNFKYLTA